MFSDRIIYDVIISETEGVDEFEIDSYEGENLDDTLINFRLSFTFNLKFKTIESSHCYNFLAKYISEMEDNVEFCNLMVKQKRRSDNDNFNRCVTYLRRKSYKYYIYLLKLENYSYYIGKTRNVDTILDEHLSKENKVRWTKLNKPIKLMCSCEMLNNVDIILYWLRTIFLYQTSNVRCDTYPDFILDNDRIKEIRKIHSLCKGSFDIDTIVRHYSEMKSSWSPGSTISSVELEKARKNFLPYFSRNGEISFYYSLILEV